MSQLDEITLYCVGCGQVVTRTRPGRVLAIACRCGANGPILHTEDGGVFSPFSLMVATGNRPVPHLEYYLGFSDHQSDLKTEITRQLRALGAISYTECSDARCRDGFQRSRANLEGN